MVNPTNKGREKVIIPRTKNDRFRLIKPTLLSAFKNRLEKILSQGQNLL